VEFVNGKVIDLGVPGETSNDARPWRSTTAA
jgi:hypothetical protein